VATQARQSQLYWSIPLLVLIALSGIAFSPAAHAADIEPSDYTLLTGDRFFLLTESSFGSGDIATVRLGNR